jgi:hypothetical protein
MLRTVVFVAGEPALLLTARESAWKAAVRDAGVTGLVRPRLRFVVSAWQRNGQVFDLDNLVEPVLRVVAPVGRIRSVWATVDVGPEPGVYIDAADPAPPPADATTITVAELPRRSTRADVVLRELDGVPPLAGDWRVGCELRLGANAGTIRFGFEGPVKPTIDALWPLLGGVPHRPHDHRIDDLRVVATNAPASTITVWRGADTPSDVAGT